MVLQSIKSTIKDTTVDLTQVECTYGKKGIRTLILNLFGEELIDVVQQGRLDAILVHNIEQMAKSVRFMVGIEQ